jgi:biotin carboxylase
MKYIWIIGGSLHQIPAIQEAKRLGLGVICSDFNNSCEAKDLVDIFVNISIYDREAHILKIEEFRKNNINIYGIVCIAVDAAITMGAVNDYFGFCGISEKIAQTCKDKTLFRELLDSSNIPNAKYQICTNQNLQELKIEELEFPVIVKPHNGFGSIGAKIFHTNIEILEYIKSLLNDFEKVLIEEFFIGEEQTVEAIFDCNGNFTPEFITDRFFTRETYPIEIGLQNPSSLPQTMQEELFTLANDVGKTLGIQSGTIKLDSIMTKNGPRVIEATVRVAGGLDPYFVVPTATGKNIMQNAILTALGEPLQHEALIDSKHKFALTGSPMPKSGKIISIRGIEEAKKLPNVEDIFLFANIGDTIKEYKDGTSRVCFVLVSHTNKEIAKQTLQEAINRIQIETI